MGICGTAMGNVALLMRDLGHQVCGCDSGIYPPMSEVLANSGIELFEGFDPDLLEKIAPDLVVVGNIISRGNPQIEWLLDTQRFAYVSLPELIRDTLLKDRKNIVVTGTHGKTTTSTLTATLLKAQGRDPGYLIGGIPRTLPQGAHVGNTKDPFVIEGDEYDSAFFDKRSKFIHYRPHVLVVNNIEFDHADIFRDLQDVKRTFQHVLRLVPKSGFVVINGDDAHIASLLPVPWTNLLRVGLDPSCDVRITDFTETSQESRFTLLWQGKPWTTVCWKVPGLFNARNAAMAALATALVESPEDPTRVNLESLGEFQSVKRRQEILHATEECMVLEDFGHHPTAITGTLNSLRNRYPDYRLVACFEPRCNTTRRRVLQEPITEALQHADTIHLAPVARPEQLPEDDRLDIATIAQTLTEQGKQAYAYGDYEQILEALLVHINQAQHKQIVCFFSNGAFGGILPKLIDQLERIEV